MSTLKLVTAQDYDDVVAMADVKKYVYAPESGDDDALLEIMRDMAIEHVEKELGRSLTSQVWDYYLDEFPDDDLPVELPRGPVIEVQSVNYTSGDAETAWGTSKYRVDVASDPARINAASAWPTIDDVTNAVRIRFRAGYVEVGSSPEAPAVPSPIKIAIMMLIANVYANRETFVIGQTAVELPWAAEQLLKPFNANKGFA